MAEKKYTIRDISELSGVSTCTVSRVLSGRAKEFRISDATAEKVLARAREVGYRPNYLAQSLNIGRTFKIGLLFANKVDTFLGDILEGAEACLRETEFQMVVATCENDIELQRRELDRMLHRQIDGVIIYPLAPPNDKETLDVHAIAEARERMPVVLIGRTISTDTDEVMFADHDAGAQVARYFLHRDAGRFACLTHPTNCTCNTGRTRGFTETLAEHGVAEKDITVVEAFEPSEETLVQLQRTEALFAVNSGLLLSFLSAMPPPQRDALFAASVGRIEGAELMDVPIHMIDPPTHEMGMQAAQTLLWRLEHPDEPIRRVELPLRNLPPAT